MIRLRYRKSRWNLRFALRQPFRAVSPSDFTGGHHFAVVLVIPKLTSWLRRWKKTDTLGAAR